MSTDLSHDEIYPARQKPAYRVLRERKVISFDDDIAWRFGERNAVIVTGRSGRAKHRTVAATPDGKVARINFTDLGFTAADLPLRVQVVLLPR